MNHLDLGRPEDFFATKMLQTVNFSEPHSLPNTVKFMLNFSLQYKLGKNVFFKSVEILDNYLTAIQEIAISTQNPEASDKGHSGCLKVLCIMAIANKLVGKRKSLKIETINGYLRFLKRPEATTKEFISLEMNILSRLNFHLDPFTKNDHLSILLVVFSRRVSLPKNLRAMSVNFLCIYCINSRKAFTTICDIAKGKALEFYSSNHFAIPAAAVLAAMIVCDEMKDRYFLTYIALLADLVRVDVLTLKIFAHILVQCTTQCNQINL